MSMCRALRASEIAEYRSIFDSDRDAQLLQNALTQAKLSDIAVSRHLVNTMSHTVSHQLDDWKVTNQKRSGRCWIFSALNMIRVDTTKKLDLKSFEFSQNFVMFWDKFERANYYLEAIDETAGRELGDRTVDTLLERVADDGGQWQMFVAVAWKHGLVPKEAMPETVSSSESEQMNPDLRTVLRQGAHDVRTAAAGAEREAVKKGVLSTVWRLLCLHLGTPPETFDWQWRDDSKNFHRDGVITPQQFRQKYVDKDLSDYVVLVDDPRPSSPRGKLFTVEYLGSVVGGHQTTYLNVDIDVLRQISMDRIVGGAPVWFGCDCGPQGHRGLGLWAADLLESSAMYATEYTLDKSDRLMYRSSAMDHAMVFTGVDVLDGRPRRWRVENSWGDDKADKGFFTMSDSWFTEFVFEIAVPRSALPDALVGALDETPVLLPAWDPMGSLAC